MRRVSAAQWDFSPETAKLAGNIQRTIEAAAGVSPAMSEIYNIDKLMVEARRLASEYRKATGKSLSISGEIARHDVARLLDLELVAENAGGYDAVGRGERAGRRVQIKGRAIFDEGKSGQRIGQVKVEQDWDSVMLLLMDEKYEPLEIYEAMREDILQALAGSESRRSNRGAMSVAKFKIIGRMVWNSSEGRVDDHGGGS